MIKQAVPNGWRYLQGRELAGKATRRRIRRETDTLEVWANARACPIHAVLGDVYR